MIESFLKTILNPFVHNAMALQAMICQNAQIPKPKYIFDTITITIMSKNASISPNKQVVMITIVVTG